MSDDPAKRRLGRGLSALLGDEEEDYASLDRVRATKDVAVGDLSPGRYQPRRHFDETEMAALVSSIRDKGILQPILVRRHPEQANRFEIIAGERRWRAAQQAQLHDVPVIIKEFDDRDALEIALVENLQRENLTPIEEAEGYQRLVAEFEHTQEALAQAIGKSRSHVANTLRLLGLPDSVKAMLDDGRLTAGHARALLGADDAAALAGQIVAGQLTVRQAEELGGQAKGTPRRPRAPRAETPVDADTLALERDLSGLLGLKVKFRFSGRGGSLSIHYDNLDQLDDVLQRLNQAPPRQNSPPDAGSAPDPDAGPDEMPALGGPFDDT